jgi:hypothetical protein
VTVDGCHGFSFTVSALVFRLRQVYQEQATTSVSSVTVEKDLLQVWRDVCCVVVVQEIARWFEFTLDAQALVQLKELVNDFDYAAHTYGKIIINERFIDNRLKTVKSIKIGGVAGGAVSLPIDNVFVFCSHLFTPQFV